MNKKTTRLRRARTTRGRIQRLGESRLCIHRTPRHMYAQVISPTGGEVLASASTLDKTVRKELKGAGNARAATQIGKLIAERAQEKGIKKVAFDRAGFKYHGRVKALADAAREAGLDF